MVNVNWSDYPFTGCFSNAFLCLLPLDVTQVLCELELTIQRVKVTTTPDGRVLDIFFITDRL